MVSGRYITGSKKFQMPASRSAATDFDLCAKWIVDSAPYVPGTGSVFQSAIPIGLCQLGECKIVVTGGGAATVSVSDLGAD